MTDKDFRFLLACCMSTGATPDFTKVQAIMANDYSNPKSCANKFRDIRKKFDLENAGETIESKASPKKQPQTPRKTRKKKKEEYLSTDEEEEVKELVNSPQKRALSVSDEEPEIAVQTSPTKKTRSSRLQAKMTTSFKELDLSDDEQSHAVIA